MLKIRKLSGNYLSLYLLFFFYSFISVLSKKAAGYEFLTKEFIYLYIIILLMFALYAFCWQQVIKKHSLLFAYTARGTVLLWVFLWSHLFFGETIKLNNVLGALIIIAGIYMVYKDES